MTFSGGMEMEHWAKMRCLSASGFDDEIVTGSEDIKEPRFDTKELNNW